MRHFPKSWVAPAAIADLPTKIRKILSRFGEVLQTPEVTSPPGSLVVARASFADLAMAQAAMQTLHGIDMRSEQEKQQAGQRPPEEGDKFWIQLEEYEAKAGHSFKRPFEPTDEVTEESYVLVRGFPPSWGEPQLRFLFVVFGGTASVQFTPDADFGRAAKVELKERGVQARAADQLHNTRVGDGDVIEECLILCYYVMGRKERQQVQAAAEAKARAEAEVKARQEAEAAAKAEAERARRIEAAAWAVEAVAQRKRLARENAAMAKADAAATAHRAAELAAKAAREAEEAEAERRRAEEERRLAEEARWEAERAVVAAAARREAQRAVEGGSSAPWDAGTAAPWTVPQQATPPVGLPAVPRFLTEAQRLCQVMAEAKAAAEIRRREAEKKEMADLDAWAAVEESRIKQAAAPLEPRAASAPSWPSVPPPPPQAWAPQEPAAPSAPSHTRLACEPQNTKQQEVQPGSEDKPGPERKETELEREASPPSKRKSRSCDDRDRREHRERGKSRQRGDRRSGRRDDRDHGQDRRGERDRRDRDPRDRERREGQSGRARGRRDFRDRSRGGREGRRSRSWSRNHRRHGKDRGRDRSRSRSNRDKGARRERSSQHDSSRQRDGSGQRERSRRESLGGSRCGRSQLRQRSSRSKDGHVGASQGGSRQDEASRKRPRSEEKPGNRSTAAAEEMEVKDPVAPVPAVEGVEMSKSDVAKEAPMKPEEAAAPLPPATTASSEPPSVAPDSSSKEAPWRRRKESATAVESAATKETEDVDTEESDYDPFAAEASVRKEDGQDTVPKEEQQQQEQEEQEDPDYDPFAAQPDSKPAAEEAAGSQPADGEEDGEEDDSEAFNALIELLRSAEQPASAPCPEEPKAPMPEVPARPVAPWAKVATPAAPAARQPMGMPGWASVDPRQARAAAAPPMAASPSAAVTSARPLDLGEEAKPKRPKPAVEYEYNPATQRWEPAKSKAPIPKPSRPAVPTPPAPQVPPGGHTEGSKPTRPCRNFPLGQCTFGARCKFSHELGDSPGAPRAPAVERDPRPRKNYIIAECEAAARADVAKGACDFMQALAVHLALRFESRPAGIISCMAEAGLPAAKDQRSTVKAIMRLCHPDKCKHPEAKRAMQILSPLL